MSSAITKAEERKIAEVMQILTERAKLHVEITGSDDTGGFLHSPDVTIRNTDQIIEYIKDREGFIAQLRGVTKEAYIRYRDLCNRGWICEMKTVKGKPCSAKADVAYLDANFDPKKTLTCVHHNESGFKLTR